MSRRRLSAYVDALVAGRRPAGFRADPEEAEDVRTAVTLSAARPGASSPDPAFVERLAERLADEAAPAGAAATPAPAPAGRRPVSGPRWRTALVAAAGAGVLVAGTAVATTVVEDQRQRPAVAAAVPDGSALRTATFQATDDQVLGQIVAYRGRPSWVFLNVRIPGYDGPIECTLQVADGTTVAFGTFAVHGGAGQFAKQIGGVNVSQLRGARLVGSNGEGVAGATFA